MIRLTIKRCKETWKEMFSRSQHVFQNTAFFNDRNFLCPFGIICLFIIIIIISTEMISKLSWLLSFLLVICGAVQGSLRSMAYFTSFFFSKAKERIYITCWLEDTDGKGDIFLFPRT